MKKKSSDTSTTPPEPDTIVKTQKRFTKQWIAVLASVALVTGTVFIILNSKAKAGPNGGDLVTFDDGKTRAEIIANSDTGEAMVHTWSEDLRSAHPIEATSLTLGTVANSLRLEANPMPDDPPGSCSRFYGHAEWIRGGGVQMCWLSRTGSGSPRHNFELNRGWMAGSGHGRMWSEMGGRGPGMGRGGPGGMRHE